MKLKFYRFGQIFNDIKNINKNSTKNIFISLIDLKVEQLPIKNRQFVKYGSQQQCSESMKQCNRDAKQQETVYSNLQYMIWVSQPVNIANNINTVEPNQSYSQACKQNQLQPRKQPQIQIRYIYLPPLCQYTKFLQNHINLKLNPDKTQKQSYSNSSKQLPLKIQLQINQKHELMYTLARSISSFAVYNFGSKYIRFNHCQVKNKEFNWEYIRQQNQRELNLNGRQVKQQQSQIYRFIDILRKDYENGLKLKWFEMNHKTESNQLKQSQNIQQALTPNDRIDRIKNNLQSFYQSKQQLCIQDKKPSPIKPNSPISHDNIPYYVVLKNTATQNDFQVYRVNITYQSQSLSSSHNQTINKKNSPDSYCSMRLEIQSQKIVVIKNQDEQFQLEQNQYNKIQNGNIRPKIIDQSHNPQILNLTARFMQFLSVQQLKSFLETVNSCGQQTLQINQNNQLRQQKQNNLITLSPQIVSSQQGQQNNKLQTENVKAREIFQHQQNEKVRIINLLNKNIKLIDINYFCSLLSLSNNNKSRRTLNYGRTYVNSYQLSNIFSEYSFFISITNSLSVFQRILNSQYQKNLPYQKQQQQQQGSLDQQQERQQFNRFIKLMRQCEEVIRSIFIEQKIQQKLDFVTFQHVQLIQRILYSYFSNDKGNKISQQLSNNTFNTTKSNPNNISNLHNNSLNTLLKQILYHFMCNKDKINNSTHPNNIQTNKSYYQHTYNTKNNQLFNSIKQRIECFKSNHILVLLKNEYELLRKSFKYIKQSQFKKEISKQIQHVCENNFQVLTFNHLNSKLHSHQINTHHLELLPSIFSHQQKISVLSTTIQLQSTHINSLSNQIIQITSQNYDQQYQIADLQQKIINYKKDEIFYKQIMSELIITQKKLEEEIQSKKKLTIDLQCQRIENYNLKQQIQTLKNTENRLIEEKGNFLQAISHLSKENIHYINLSAERLSTINSLQSKLQKFKSIDTELNDSIQKNKTLKFQNESIKKWKVQIESNYKNLINKQVSKFNRILQLNYNKFVSYQKENMEIAQKINVLNNQLFNKQKVIYSLQEEIKYLKGKYFFSNVGRQQQNHSNLILLQNE